MLLLQRVPCLTNGIAATTCRHLQCPNENAVFKGGEFVLSLEEPGRSELQRLNPSPTPIGILRQRHLAQSRRPPFHIAIRDALPARRRDPSKNQLSYKAIAPLSTLRRSVRNHDRGKRRLGVREAWQRTRPACFRSLYTAIPSFY